MKSTAKRSIKVFDKPLTLLELQNEVKFIAQEMGLYVDKINSLISRIAEVEHTTRNDKEYDL